MMQHNSDGACGPLMKALAFAVLRPGCRRGLYQKNHKLFNSPACEAVYCVFFPVSGSVANKWFTMTEQMKKRWMTTDDKTKN